MATAKITWPLPASGSINQQIQYRLVGATPWTTYSTVGPTVNTANLTLPVGNYEFQIVNICSGGTTTFSARSTFYVCSCPTGYTKNTKGNCQKVSTQAPTTLFSNYCLAPSKLDVYSEYFTRIYNTGFQYPTIQEAVATRTQDVFAQYTTIGQWRSDPDEVPTTDVKGNFIYVTGPMNRAAVWVDSDCDGIKNGLSSSAKVTISYAYNNTGTARRMYVGIGADNLFTLNVNGNEVAKITNPTPPENFKIWHVFPVDTIEGWNYFNAVATGDGTINDAIGMMVYDIQNPTTFNGTHSSGSTYDTGLNILFNTNSLINQHIDISTCTAGYDLDTKGGQGNYICTRTDIQSCG